MTDWRNVMSSYHYTITSKKRAKEYKSNKKDHKNYLIEDVTELIENNSPKYNPYSLSKGKLCPVFNTLMFFVTLNMLFLFILCIAGNDIMNYYEGIYSFSSNMIAISGVMFALTSIPVIRNRLSKIFLFGKIGNSLIIILLCLVISFFLTVILFYLGLQFQIANLVSFFGLLICMYSIK